MRTVDDGFKKSAPPFRQLRALALEQDDIGDAPNVVFLRPWNYNHCHGGNPGTGGGGGRSCEWEGASS
jgi:hypothetical protein